jgi:hypothetical protein
VSQSADTQPLFTKVAWLRTSVSDATEGLIVELDAPESVTVPAPEIVPSTQFNAVSTVREPVVAIVPAPVPSPTFSVPTVELTEVPVSDSEPLPPSTVIVAVGANRFPIVADPLTVIVGADPYPARTHTTLPAPGTPPDQSDAVLNEPELGPTHALVHAGPTPGETMRLPLDRPAVNVTDPAALAPVAVTVAVSCTSTSDPTSAEVNVYCVPVAPGMLTHALGWAPTGQLTH